MIYEYGVRFANEIYKCFVIFLLQLNQLEIDKIPWIDKYDLKEDYSETDNHLSKLLNVLERGGSQAGCTKSVLDSVKYQKTRFEHIKKKHDKLKEHYKNHRMSILFYIFRFLSRCENNSNSTRSKVC